MGGGRLRVCNYSDFSHKINFDILEKWSPTGGGHLQMVVAHGDSTGNITKLCTKAKDFQLSINPESTIMH